MLWTVTYNTKQGATHRGQELADIIYMDFWIFKFPDFLVVINLFSFPLICDKNVQGDAVDIL